MLLNVCQQAEVGSITRATTPINMFVSWDETQNTNDDKLVKNIQRMTSIALIKYQNEVYIDDILTECNHPQLHFPV